MKMQFLRGWVRFLSPCRLRMAVPVQDSAGGKHRHASKNSFVLPWSHTAPARPLMFLCSCLDWGSSISSGCALPQTSYVASVGSVLFVPRGV